LSGVLGGLRGGVGGAGGDVWGEGLSRVLRWGEAAVFFWGGVGGGFRPGEGTAVLCFVLGTRGGLRGKDQLNVRKQKEV